MPLNRQKVREVLLKSIWYILLYLIANYLFVHLLPFIRSFKNH